MIKTRKGQVFLRSIVVIAILIALAATVGVLVLGLANMPAEGIGSGALFTVNKGESAQAVALSLLQKGYIRSSFVFRFFAKAEGLGSDNCARRLHHITNCEPPRTHGCHVPNFVYLSNTFLKTSHRTWHHCHIGRRLSLSRHILFPFWILCGWCSTFDGQSLP